MDVDVSDSRDVEQAGDGSRVYHESAVDPLDSVHDDRVRRVLINDRIVGDAGGLLVDTVSYDAGTACPEHYHEGTKHFFYVLEGEGVIEVEGEPVDLERGAVAWVGEGDAHRLYVREDQAGMTVFEFFSNGDGETVYTSGDACTWTPEES